METLHALSYAKINLFLDILDKRDDGYHDLCMINARISLHDKVHCMMTPKYKVTVLCSDGRIPTDSRNTAFQAATRLLDQLHSKYGVQIRIDKAIPHGAGLGGGSSNAATVLLLINHMLGDPLSVNELMLIGEGIGADVPFFIADACCYIRGKGEQIVPISLHNSFRETNIYVVLCSPTSTVSTGEAYRLWDQSSKKIHKSPTPMLNTLMEGKWDNLNKHLFNAFESVIFKAEPSLKEAYETFRSISPTRPLLSGSGSNMYSLHLDQSEAEVVVADMEAEGYSCSSFKLLF